jgi:hypothetical protein
MQQPAEVVVGTKNEETLALFVPVRSHASEYGCSIKEAVGGYIDVCFGKRNNFSLKEGMLREIHKAPPAKGIGTNSYERIITDAV